MTGNLLDFHVLSPEDFERLCLWLVTREGFQDAKQYGGPGDKGRDVVAQKDGRQYVFQCKRYQSFGKADAEKEIEKTKTKLDPLPDVLVFVTSCPPSAPARDLKTDAFELEFWGRSELDEMVKRHEDVRKEFFRRVFSGPTNLFLAPRRNPYFTGREQVLADLRARLVKGGSAALSQAITGLGGIGKTQTAIEYCHRYAEEYQHVLWVSASSEAELSGDLASVAHELELVDEATPPEAAAKELLKWLNTTTGWVLVFDNADEPEVLGPYLLKRPKGHVLVTSRKRAIPGFPSPLSMEVLGEDESVALLARRLDRGFSEDEKGVAKELAEALGYLPLAIEQASAYMASRNASLSSYLDRFRRQRLAFLEKGHPDSEYHATVATTWQVSFEAVEDESKAAADVLRVCAFLAPDAIPFEIFTQGGERLGPEIAAHAAEMKEEPLELADMVEPLGRYSLISVDGTDQTLSVHRLVQAVTRAELGDEAQVWQERVVEGVAAVMPEAGFAYEHWPAARRLFNHVQALVDGGAPLESEAGASMLQGAGGFAKSQGWYRLSADFRQTSLDARYRVLGEEHPDTLNSMSNLALTFHDLGDLKGARDLQQQTLHVRRRVLGEEHPHTLISMGNLALTFRDLGDFEGAHDLQQQTLDSCRRVLGEEHPHTLAFMNNLASTLRDLGDFEGARNLQQQTLDVRRRVLGEEHPSTLTSMNNLAGTLYGLGDFEGAHDLQQQSLHVRRRVLGEEHPHTLTSMNDLALTLHALGDFEGAHDLQQQTLDVRRRVLGEEHPDTLTSMNNLAAALHALGDLRGSRDLLQQTLDVRRRVLGEEHPDTVQSQANLAVVLKALEDD